MWSGLRRISLLSLALNYRIRGSRSPLRGNSKAELVAAPNFPPWAAASEARPTHIRKQEA